MMSEVLIVLLCLFFVWEAVRAIRTGEVSAKGSVIRRADALVPFYLVVGVLLFFAVVVLDVTIGFELLMKLINLNL